MKNFYKNLFIISLINLLFIVPVMALDLDSTVNDSGRKTYSSASTVKQQASKKEVIQTKSEFKEPVIEKPVIKQDLPTVPALPKKANSSTVAPINDLYTGKMPNSDALIPCTDIRISALTINKSASRSKQKKSKVAKSFVSKNYRSAKLAKGTQLRVINKTRISDSMPEGQSIIFVTTQELSTPYFKIPKNTKLTARVVSSHRPQLSCNGGLVGVRVVSANINGYNQTIDAGLVRLEADTIYFSNLKGEHTYCKTVVKKAKWGQNMFSKWAKTSHSLANKGPGVILAPFPYIGGCVLSAASTVSSPVTALLGKGGSLVIKPNTAFTIKLYDDAQIRY